MKLKQQQDTHSKKLFDLGFENSQASHDPDRVIFNYSSHVLTESEKSLLCKGLNFAIPSKTLEYVDYLLPFELLCRNTKEVLKTRIKDCAFSSFNSCNENGAPLNLTTEEFAVLKSLSKNKNLIIQNRIKVTLLPLLTKEIVSKKCEISYLILLNLLKFL